MQTLYELIYTIFMAYAALFPVLNPLGNSIVFNSIAYELSNDGRSKVAKKIAKNIFFLLITILFVGAWVLKLFGIPMPIVQVGGGAVVASVAWRIMNKAEDDSQPNPYRIFSEEKGLSMAFFPLTLPMICGPGTITVAVTLGANEFTKSVLLIIAHYLGLSIGIALMAITAFFCYQGAGYLTQRVGKNGTLVIMKLSAFISLCIGLTIVWKGVQGLLMLLSTANT